MIQIGLLHVVLCSSPKLFLLSAEQLCKPAYSGLGGGLYRGLHLLDRLLQLGALGILDRPVGLSAACAAGHREVRGKAQALARRVGHQHHIAVAALRQLPEADLTVQRIQRESGGVCLRRRTLHGLVCRIQNSHLHAGQGSAGSAVSRTGQCHAAAGADIHRVAHALQPQTIGLCRHAVVICSDVPVTGRSCNGHAGAGNGDAAVADVPRRVGAIENTVGVVGQQHRMGLGAVVEDDALRVLLQQGDQHRRFALQTGGQGGSGVANFEIMFNKLPDQRSPSTYEFITNTYDSSLTGYEELP